MRSPTNTSAVEYLMSQDVSVNTVLDVGAAKNTWALQEAFPDKKHILFEPMVEFRDECKKNYEDKKIDYELHNVALSDIVDPHGQMFYNTHLSHAGAASYIWSGVVPKDTESYHGNTHPKRNVSVTTLDSFLSGKTFDKPYYLKVDTDGQEMNVLRGAKGILKDCSVIQVESCIHSNSRECIWNQLKWFEDNGFHIWDIVDMFYIDNMLWQVDLLFISSENYRRIKSQHKKRDRTKQIFTFVGNDGSYNF